MIELTLKIDGKVVEAKVQQPTMQWVKFEDRKPTEEGIYIGSFSGMGVTRNVHSLESLLTLDTLEYWLKLELPKTAE